MVLNATHSATKQTSQGYADVEWLSQLDCAQHLGCSTQFIRNLIKRGKLIQVEFSPRKKRIHVDDWARYLQSRRDAALARSA